MKINTKSINIQWLIMTIGLVLMICAQSFAAEKPKMATDIPPEITTSDKVETQIGTLEFFDGMPGKETVQKAYDNLDFMRGVEVFKTIGSRRCLEKVGISFSVFTDRWNHTLIEHGGLAMSNWCCNQSR